MNYEELLRVRYDIFTNEFEVSIHPMMRPDKTYRSMRDYFKWVARKDSVGTIQYRDGHPEYYEKYDRSNNMQIKMAVSKMADALEFDLTCKIKNLETQRKELSEAIRKYRKEN